MSWVTIFHLMRDISCNKPTQKYNPLINAFTLPVNENNRVVRPIGPDIKGTISRLIISSAQCQFIISDAAQCFMSKPGLQNSEYDFKLFIFTLSSAKFKITAKQRLISMHCGGECVYYQPGICNFSDLSVNVKAK